MGSETYKDLYSWTIVSDFRASVYNDLHTYSKSFRLLAVNLESFVHLSQPRYDYLPVVAFYSMFIPSMLFADV